MGFLIGGVSGDWRFSLVAITMERDRERIRAFTIELCVRDRAIWPSRGISSDPRGARGELDRALSADRSAHIRRTHAFAAFEARNSQPIAYRYTPHPAPPTELIGSRNRLPVLRQPPAARLGVRTQDRSGCNEFRPISFGGPRSRSASPPTIKANGRVFVLFRSHAMVDSQTTSDPTTPSPMS